MSLPAPYYSDDAVTIYHGDASEVLRFSFVFPVAAVVTDPPRGETSLTWDSWVDGWPSLLQGVTNSLWVFGSLRMFMGHQKDFEAWTLAQEIIWQKHNGTNPFNDRFRCVHEIAAQFYSGKWSDVYKAPVHTNDAVARTVRRKKRPPQWGDIGEHRYTSKDGGPRLMRSVINVKSCHGFAVHPTQKPEGILRPLIQYSVPKGGVVLDLFSGSGSTLLTAKMTGRKAIGIEANEAYCEIAAKRCSQTVMAMEVQ